MVTDRNLRELIDPIFDYLVALALSFFCRGKHQDVNEFPPRLLVMERKTGH